MYILDEFSQLGSLHPPRSQGTGACGSRIGRALGGNGLLSTVHPKTDVSFGLWYDGVSVFPAYPFSIYSFRIVNVEGVMDIVDDVYSGNLIH